MARRKSTSASASAASAAQAPGAARVSRARAVARRAPVARRTSARLRAPAAPAGPAASIAAPPAVARRTSARLRALAAPAAVPAAPAAVPLVAPPAVAARPSTVARPYNQRDTYCIDRELATEMELKAIRSGYPELLGRKDCYKNPKCQPGDQRSIEMTMEELMKLYKYRGYSKKKIAEKEKKKEKKHEFRKRASDLYKTKLARMRKAGKAKGHPGTLPRVDRIVPNP